LIVEIPESFGLLIKLKDLILINNRIKKIPDALFKASSIEVLILNSNPISAVPNGIEDLKRLKVLGLASTNIRELPEVFNSMNFKELEQILVHDTNLVTPSLAIALRGVAAIKVYFDHKTRY